MQEPDQARTHLLREDVPDLVGVGVRLRVHVGHDRDARRHDLRRLQRLPVAKTGNIELCLHTKALQKHRLPLSPCCCHRVCWLGKSLSQHYLEAKQGTPSVVWQTAETADLCT